MAVSPENMRSGLAIDISLMDRGDARSVARDAVWTPERDLVDRYQDS